jgi:hypothetical protein
VGSVGEPPTPYSRSAVVFCQLLMSGLRPRAAARSLQIWGRGTFIEASRIGQQKSPEAKGIGATKTNQALIIRHFLKQADVPAFLTLIALMGGRIAVHFACVPEWNCRDSQLFFAVNRLVTVSANERLHWRTLPSEKKQFKTGVGMLAVWKPLSEGNPEKNGIDWPNRGAKDDPHHHREDVPRTIKAVGRGDAKPTPPSAGRRRATALPSDSTAESARACSRESDGRAEFGTGGSRRRPASRSLRV